MPIRAHGGTLSYVELDSICALFGLDSGSARASQRALQAAGAIEGVISISTTGSACNTTAD